MQTRRPERIVAVWLRSGSAFAAWEKGEIPKPEIPAAAYRVPTVCNPGAKERDDARFRGAWDGPLAMARAYRAAGALVAFVPDPRTSHECGDSRYAAIPFFDECLAARLPEAAEDPAGDTNELRPLDAGAAWLAPLLGGEAQPVGDYAGDVAEASWLPSARLAKVFAEYAATGAVGDDTPPPAPTDLAAAARDDGGIELTWRAEADLDSGLRQFVVERDGREIGRVPETPVGRFGRPLFQSMSYHDTPEAPLPELQFVDPAGTAEAVYRVRSVNSVELVSEPSAAAQAAE